MVVELLGGVYFPVTVLPDWLEKVAGLFPLIYAIRSVEMAIYQGATVSELSSDIMSLFLFAAVLFPVGIFMLRFALKKAKLDGSLIQY
jgi:ABC-2 type transport system permease protein